MFPREPGTCATPDGRHSGDPLAKGCSPTHAADKNGPTSVFKSVSKLKTQQIVGGVLLNQKLTPQILDQEENRLKLSLLIRTFFDDLKGFHVQYNVVSKQTLLDAQAHPERHADLIVRWRLFRLFHSAVTADAKRYHRANRAGIISRTIEKTVRWMNSKGNNGSRTQEETGWNKR